MKGKIEFCGVPGAGKSTLSERCRSLLKKRGYSLLSREEMREKNIARRNYGLVATTLGHIFPPWRRSFLGLSHGLNDWHKFVVDFPEFSAYFHELLSRGKEDESWRSTVFYALLTSAYEHQLSRDSIASVVFDEGFAQRCFTLLGYRQIRRLGDATQFGALMPPPIAVIWVATAPEVCLTRLKLRERFPVLLDTVETESLGGVHAWSDLFRELLESLKKRGVKVLEIEGVNDVNTQSEVIADYLEALL
jgi:thymidylate kinase